MITGADSFFLKRVWTVKLQLAPTFTWGRIAAPQKSQSEHDNNKENTEKYTTLQEMENNYELQPQYRCQEIWKIVQVFCTLTFRKVQKENQTQTNTTKPILLDRVLIHLKANTDNCWAWKQYTVIKINLFHFWLYFVFVISNPAVPQSRSLALPQLRNLER